jgi:hypothetical protein
VGGCPCDISDCILRLNVDLEAIFRWSVESGLSLNSVKTQAMIICRDRGRLPALLPAVLVDGRTVPYCLAMDNRFSWRGQVNLLLLLSQFADVTPVMTRKKLVQYLVILHFFYFYFVTLFIRVLRWRSIEGLLWHLILVQDTFLASLGFGVFLHILRKSWEFL